MGGGSKTIGFINLVFYKEYIYYLERLFIYITLRVVIVAYQRDVDTHLMFPS